MRFDIVVTVLSVVSGVACCWMLRDLVKLPRFTRRRLFWRQLAALATTDLLEAIAGVLSAHVPPPTELSCEVYIYTRYALEFTSALIEVQIGAGFAAACLHARVAIQTLRVLLLVSLPLGIFLVLIAKWNGFRPIVDVRDHECNDAHGYGPSMWSVTIAIMCCLSVLFYLCSVLATRTTPSVVRKRALLRAFTYAANFVVTFGFRAVFDLAAPHDGNYGDFWLQFSRLSWALVCLNGFVNVLTYAVQNRQKKSKTEVDFQVGFESNVSENSVQTAQTNASAMQAQILLHTHFDLRWTALEDSEDERAGSVPLAEGQAACPDD